MSDTLSRTAMLLGKANMDRLKDSRVAVFGLGGVGGYAVEALARSGVGALDLIDHDVFSRSNINRQLHALHSTVGMYKADAAKARVLDINPSARVNAIRLFFTPDTSGDLDFSAYDCVLDAIDTVSGKLELITRAHAAGLPVISAMACGNKLDPTKLEVADIFDTAFDPLARIMRKELRRRGVDRLTVVYSKEPALRPSGPEALEAAAENPGRRDVPGSTAFVPAAAGLIMAAQAVRLLLGENFPKPL